MAVPPKLPKLAAEDMAWARWVTKAANDSLNDVIQLNGRVTSANQQRATVAGAAATTSAHQTAFNPAQNQLPIGDPQTPTDPQITTDHGTVTIRWDGRVNVNGTLTPPAQGFSFVTVQRSDDSSAFVPIGSRVGVAGTIVDSDVIVGKRYNYRLISTDTLGRVSPPSNVLTIVVKGVDLGSLDQDVLDALDDIRHSATTGGLVQYSPDAPTDPAYHDSRALWFDTSDPNGVVPNRWNGTDWVPIPYGSGALGPGSVVASKILAGAIDTYHLGAGIVTTEKLEAGSVVAETLAADSVTTNKVAAGAIDANKIAVGAIDARALNVSAVPSFGTPVNRVPADVKNSGYWSQVIAGNVVGFRYIGTGLTVANASGLVLGGNSSAVRMSLTTEYIPVPTTHKLNLQVVSSGNGALYVACYDANKKLLRELGVPSGELTLPVDTAFYNVFVVNFGAPGTFLTIVSAGVFEVIGTGSSQHSEISPAGLRLFNDAGDLAVDLSTNSNNFLTIYNDGQANATVDEDGNGSFNAVQANDDFYVNGVPVVGTFADNLRADGSLDGPLLDRVPRGVFYAATWANMNDVTVGTQYQRIATGAFQLHPDRAYQFDVDLGGLQTVNNSGVNVYVELQLSTAPLTSVTTGTVVARSVVYNGDNGYFNLPSLMFMSPSSADFDIDARTLPSDTDIYWQINTNLSAVPTSSYKFSAFTAGAAGFTLLDMGPALTVFDGTDRTTGGGTATGGAGSGGGSSSGGSGTGSSTTQSQTKTWNASWTASWRANGSTKVTGSGTYTDGNMLYQGYGASPMGSKIGFPSITSTLSGKTVTKVELFLQNRWTYANAGGTIELGGHSNSSEPSTYGSNVDGSGFSRDWSRGQGKWVTISNSDIPYSQWKSGAVRGISLTIQSDANDYAYFDGVGKSKPPKLRITYK